ncbi:MAG: glycerophosphodiester phosphodiesterase family protein [Oscillospiraceae bacterium]|nr:glycerophosphodiester phosphodiesterase family protein [Oscillospiraceae bacterium]
MFTCKIIAHRGANQYAPQNTIPAFQKAIALGADGLETDVHVTRDGALVLCHNYSIDETSNGLGNISEYTLKDLKSLDFGASFSRKFRGTPLPSLDEFLELCKRSPLKIMNIELKSPKMDEHGIVRKTLEAVERFGLLDRLLISSFDPTLLAQAKALEPDCRTALLYPTPQNAIPFYLHPPYGLVQKIGADAVHPFHGFVSAAMVRHFHKMGVRVHPWTVNSPSAVRKLLVCGVDGIITDRPRDVAEITRKCSCVW